MQCDGSTGRAVNERIDRVCLLRVLPGVRRRAAKAEPTLTPGTAERSGAALI